MLNTKRQLLSRLVGLFPVKLIKDHFKLDVKEVAATLPEKDVAGYCYANLSATKQHVYIYKLDKQFDINTFKQSDFPLEIILSSSDNITYTFICNATVTFNVILKDPYSESKIKFIQPISIKLKNKHLIIQATILEKSIASYYPGQHVIDSSREVAEEITITEIRTFFEQNYKVPYCDLNKGIKAIWDKEIIDSKVVKYKKNKSTSTESMDEGYTVKKQYPDVYKELTKGPINKTLFKYLLEDDILVDHFTADPTWGRLSIAVFPKNPNQINNVIETILSSN
jgi:hypothetical protein